MRLPLLAAATVFLVVPLPAQSREIRDSIATLERRVAEDSTDAGLQYRLAIYYFAAKRFDDEQRMLKRVIAIDPRYAPAYLAIADSAYERRPKLYEEVRRRRVPRELQAAVERAQSLQRRAYLIDPLADFRVRGTEAPPEGVVAIPVLREMLDPATEAGRALTNYLLFLGLTTFYATRYELSYDALRKHAERAYATKPRDSIPDYLFWFRGLAAGHRGIYNVAIEDFQTLLDRALKEERTDTLIPYPLRTNDYRYTLAVLYHGARRPADALRLYQESIANDLGLYMAHVRLAEVYRQFKMWPQAIEEQRRAIAANPEDPTALYELGVILAEAGKPAEAEEPLRQAMAQNPLDPRIPYNLGMVAHQLNKPAEAREAFSRVVALGSGRYATLVADARQRLASLQ